MPDDPGRVRRRIHHRHGAVLEWLTGPVLPDPRRDPRGVAHARRELYLRAEDVTFAEPIRGIELRGRLESLLRQLGGEDAVQAEHPHVLPGAAPSDHVPRALRARDDVRIETSFRRSGPVGREIPDPAAPAEPRGLLEQGAQAQLVLLRVEPEPIQRFRRRPRGGLLLETAREPEVTSSIRLTLLTSMGATLIFALFSVPFAYLLARKDFPLKQLVNGIVDLPIVIPHSAAGIALLGILSRGTLIGELGERMGVRFVGGYAGIMAAMAFVRVPFLINAARDGFAAVPEQLEKAARSLGASPLRVFFTISVPMAWRSILSGSILMWARGMSEFGAVLVVAYHPMITPVLLYERLGAFGL